MTSMDFYAVIVAAGSGDRFQDDLPKQYHLLKNRPILEYSLAVFSKMIPPENIVVCINETHEPLFKQSVSMNFPDISYVIGGVTRSESVFKGLEFFVQKSLKRKNTKILIHDAARPLILTPIIGKLVESLTSGNSACTLVKKASNTVCLSKQGQKVDSYISRDEIYEVQTPQGFDFDVLYNAHVKSQGEGLNSFTDDTSLLHHYGTEIDLVENPEPNFKITTKQDLVLAEALLNDR